MEPEIDLDPDTETRETDPQLVAKVIEGKKLAKDGKIEEAINLYNQAQKLDSDVEIDVRNWLKLCEFGSGNNQAQDVMFACEKAVKLNPNDSYTQSIRGLARALTGDYQGAIDDLKVFVDDIKTKKNKARFEGWIETLKKRENPFTNDVLKELKKNLTD